MTEADRLLYATLAGAAARHAGLGALAPEQEATAVAELREIAGHRPAGAPGRDRDRLRRESV